MSGVSDHRRSRSRHRDAPGRHRPLARGGRVGILVAAVLTTVAVAAFGLKPSSGPEPSSASGAQVAPESAPSDGVEEANDDPDRNDEPGKSAEEVAEVPVRSGHGRRVVFDMSGQRVWMVNRDESVRATYLVSGSKSNNLRPGAYRVYSRSKHAVGFDYHSTMRYFVRFAHGERSNIGFHDIPVDHAGRRVQSYDDLGTPQSAGCIRQRRSDAREMWRFAPIGTRVVVVA